MTDTPPPEADFDGCNSECRKAGKHSLRWGGCEQPTPPEPTVSMSVVYTEPSDGYPAIGFDTYTVPQLAELIEPALNATALRAWRKPSEVAAEVARAIVHRHDDEPVPVVPVSSPPPDQTPLRDILRAVLNTFPTNLNPAGPAVQGRHVPVELLERWRRYAEAEQPAAVPPTADRAAVLREAAEVVHETTAPASWTADSISCWNTATNIAESKLRRLAAEAQPPCAECGHAYADHEEGEDPVSPGRCRACEDDFGWHNYQPAKAQEA